MGTRKSLRQLYPKKRDVIILTVAALALLVLGIHLPVLYFQQMVLWKHTYSIWTGIVALAREGDWFLAAVIFLFSIVFPFAKLVSLLCIWFVRLEPEAREKLLRGLEMLGKWSMLDVFVIAVTIVIVKVGGSFAKAEPRPGLYVFSLAVFLSMILTGRVHKLAAREARP